MTALLFAALLQEPEIERLLRQLDADDVAVRDEAVRRLIEIGDPALAAVETSAASENPEVAARAAAAARGIREASRLRGILGDPRTVAVEAKDEPLADVLKRLRSESGFPFKIRAVPGADRITCSIRAASPAAALEEVCAAHGGIRFDPVAMEVTRGRPAPYPAKHDGKFSLYLTAVDSELYRDGGNCTARLMLLWDTPAAPLNADLSVSTIVDDKGDSLLDGGGLAGAVFVVEDGSPEKRGGPRARSIDQPLQIPDDDAKTLTIAGTVEIDYEVERDVFTFENPDEAMGRSQTIGDVTCSLVTYMGGSLALQFSGPASELEKANAFEGIRVELVTEDDLRLRIDLYVSSFEEGNETIVGTMEGWMNVAAGIKIKRLEAVRTRSTYHVSIPFEFDEIKLR